MKKKTTIREAGEMTSADKIYEKTKVQAAKIRAKAELIRAQNQLDSAKLNQQKIAQKASSLENSSGQKPEEVRVSTVADPSKQQKVAAQESRFYKSAYYKYINEAAQDDGQQPPPEEDPNQQDPNQQPSPDGDPNQQPPQDQPQVEIAGTTPQTKEEAETARIQAATREIQARIGEYNTGAGQQEDPSGGMEGDPNMQDPNDPNAMGGDPSMMDPNANQPPDPLKGFGDISAPPDPMGGDIDPATGMPSTDPKITYSALGRLYHLKKIYDKLLTLNFILTKYPYNEVVPIRKDIREMINVITLISNNLKSYKEKIDEIIINMYDFLKEVTQRIMDVIVDIKQSKRNNG